MAINWKDHEIDGMTACAIHNALFKAGRECEEEGKQEIANLLLHIGYVIAEAEGNPISNLDELPNDLEWDIVKKAFRCN